MYQYIQNPLTLNLVNINSKIGKKNIKKLSQEYNPQLNDNIIYICVFGDKLFTLVKDLHILAEEIQTP